ncbi:YafY family transcriptional regulator [Agrobacterium vitis]|uniref:HTH domain-containing protein n=1 Tax=Agrobacterium vitis TaxID=373 RepID=A0AAE4WGU8_AGRVI|nr:YafY family protein [Agrobacterium vitis]MCF1497627.1 YafY family transcriptional regulator [Allorhizobium sp. Av2]MCM2441484.1 YafY family transcriptional regulator [Agrobacterium vitis]MUZ59428.1 HTH domain-containing protein [Agrobacterium vitis]MVA67947.1 HTH domain-containing protein [Agrobacterium vitis]MVA89691.1 HTH domain-containing protein [Agrobacterium vitis]
MTRSERLLSLLQILRRYRRPVTGQILAEELGVSIRTLYRDIATLQSQGAGIEGEAGLGYVLRPGYMLPPLMFSPQEIEALVLGARFVAQRTDQHLAFAARDALAKITAVLPDELRRSLEDNSLLVGPSDRAAGQLPADLSPFRHAIRAEHVLHIVYRDEKGATSNRDIWPFALTFFEGARILLAWCTLRDDFRHFRCDRIGECKTLALRYPVRRASLLKRWREHNSIPDWIL